MSVDHAPGDVVFPALPFPAAATAAEAAAPSDPPPATVERCGRALRTSHVVWRQATRHLPPSLGSLATELTVLVDEARKPHPATSFRGASRATRMLQEHLVRSGVDLMTAFGMAKSVVHAAGCTNHMTLRLVHALVASRRAVPVVFRIALKPMPHVAGNAKTGAVWFRTSHANVCVVHPHLHALLLFEPMGREPLPGFADKVAAWVLGDYQKHYTVLHNHYMDRPVAVAPSNTLCTVWCAVAALVALANPAHDPARFWRLVQWGYDEQNWLLRLFVRHVAPLLDPPV